MAEKWKPVKGWQGLYEVSDHGRIRSLSRHVTICDAMGRIYEKRIPGRLRKLVPDKRGYLQVMLTDAKTERRSLALVHRLVAEAFIPNLDHLPEVNHLNGEKGDNRVQNLEWCTRTKNVRHSFDVLGNKCGREKFTDEQVRAIRSMKGSCYSIARKFGASPETIRLIRMRKTYAEVV